MPPETRRAARAAAADAETRRRAARQTGRSSSARARSTTEPSGRRRAVGIVVAVIAVILLGIAAWLGFRALTVKNDLTEARAALTGATDGGDFRTAFATVADKSASAASATADPIWRVAEYVPWAGENLRAVRLASEALNVVANGIGVPVLDLQADGQGEILARALPVIESGAQTLAPVTEELLAIADSPMLIGMVRDGVDEVAAVLEPAQPLLELMPTLLGADSPKHYLLVFQNNAESLPLGGSAASQTLLSADAGDLEIVTQASSGSFEEKVPLDFEVSDGAAALYGSTLGKRINMSTTQPDWPTAAQMIVAFWHRDIDDTAIDGVVSIDPVALSRILVATGPITVDDVTIDDSNAVDILLSDVYEWWDAYTRSGAVATDEFFAATAAQVFDTVASGDFDLKDMLWAVNESVAQGSIMAWMADENVQSVLEDGGRIAGILPTTNDDQTTLGVYFRDVSASKIDYYMDTTVDAAMTCDAGTATLTATATLHLDLTQDEADALPRYVQSFRNGSSYFSTQVFLYAPPGFEVADVDVAGNWVEPFREGNVDLGRVVAPFQMRITPGETVTVTATFTGAQPEGALDVRTTPMVRATDLLVSDTCG
ncbi:DUF4012 domain-containing protein [Microbacterium sp. MC2]